MLGELDLLLHVEDFHLCKGLKVLETSFKEKSTQTEEFSDCIMNGVSSWKLTNLFIFSSFHQSF